MDIIKKYIQRNKSSYYKLEKELKVARRTLYNIEEGTYSQAMVEKIAKHCSQNKTERDTYIINKGFVPFEFRHLYRDYPDLVYRALSNLYDAIL